MKTYDFKGVKLNFPENLSEVTVEQLIEVHSLGELSNSISDIIKMIKVFAPDINPAEISFEAMIEITGLLGKTLSECANLEGVNSFEIGGEKYTCQDPNDLSVKEFIDFQELSTDPVENLPLLLALVYKSESEGTAPDDKYVEVLMEKKNKFMHLDAKTAQGCLLFFSNVFINYVSNTFESLATDQKQKKAIQKAMEELKQLNAGGGN